MRCSRWPHDDQPGHCVGQCEHVCECDGEGWPCSTAVVLDEYHRRGKVEQAAAAYILAGLCGTYDSAMPDRDRDHSEALTALIAAVRTNPDFRGRPA